MAVEAQAYAATWSATAMTARLIDFYRRAIENRAPLQPELSGQQTG